MSTKIKVIGIGGSGSNTISRMKRARIKGVEMIAINTDAQALNKARADLKLRIGKKTTQGLGAGMNPEVGKMSVLENQKELSEILKNAAMIFITGGEGGGTFTGAAPIVAEVAKESGALTIAVTTRPFSFEGQVRAKIAEQGIKELREKVDALIVISNDKLLSVLDSDISLLSAFSACDDILRQAVQGISDLIILPGIINVDFADVRTIMASSGSALFGMGKAQGEDRIEKAALAAINSPLLDTSMKGAKGVLFNISGEDISLSEIDQAAKVITKEINPAAKVIFGAVQNEKLKKGEIKITVIATGL
ncbi:cell division protein FtsZ [Dehalococcoidia bacterium]|nr:cell division protein FtsZ [Dehalococcoidia bacterium]